MDSDKLRGDFLLDFDNHTFCNHGSYGAPPRCVFEYRQKLLSKIESDVEKWDRFKLLEEYKRSCRRAAEFIDADESSVVLVRNTTSGINTIMQSLGDKITGIVVFSHVYAAMMNTSKTHEAKFKCPVFVVDINLPIKSASSVVETFKKVINDNKEINFALMDHISSASAIVFPIKELIEVCAKKNIMSCIDGAHAPGQLDLSMRNLDPDFYVGNLHKWCYAMRGTALVYISGKFSDEIRPLATSHNCNKDLQSDFYDQGTDDITNYLLVDKALAYYNEIGGLEALKKNAETKLNALRRRLCKEVNCEWYPIPEYMEAPFMKIVKLPENCRYEKSWKGADQLWSDLNEKFKLSVYISYANGSLWLRISANCYNTHKDMNAVFDKVSQMLKATYPIVYRRSANSTD